jgi:uncharacterized delta-60 repeat protein
LEDRTVPTAGFLDPTFGTIPTLPGRVVTDIGAGLASFIAGVALQDDGKIVAAGTILNPGGNRFALARYDSDGRLDTKFGPDGTGEVVTDFGGNESALSVILQADGKILAAGTTIRGGQGDFLVARYNSDGSLDDGGPNDSTPGDSFGKGGNVVTDFGGEDFAQGVILQADGKIVAAGDTVSGVGSEFALARYNSDGSLDDGGPNDSTPGDFFGKGGKIVTDFGGGPSSLRALAVQADGKIVAAGSTQTKSLSSSYFALARYNTDGSLDADFDADGKVVTDFGGSDGAAKGVVVQSDGKIVAAGISDGAGQDDFALARYNPDGSLDTHFDKDGKVVTDLGGSDDARCVVLQSDGKIVAAGATTGGGGDLNFALARYNPNGSLDTSFNFDGKVATDFAGGGDLANSAVIQPDGKIILAGSTGSGVTQRLALARYLGDPANQPPVVSDQTFGINENSASGTVVGSVVATDPDSGQTLTYQIIAGNSGGAFALDSSTGQLTVANRTALDFETNPTFTVTIRVSDNGSPALSSTATVTINLGDVNEAPVNRVPTVPQAATKNKTLTFSSANGNAISVSDPDATTTVIQVSLTVLHGKLTLAGTAGLTFLVGDGKVDGTMTFRGTIAAINAALNGLTYAPDRGFVGSDGLTVTTNDLGSGLGGALFDTDVVAILVQDGTGKGK